ncbi:syntaphilin [Colossoma macropomum]|uniref:syntaphilin n=1 Tax=Colossoma macropomum TaxID=42526 RepID=UPI001864541D|nr:syntaphilin [Colossoma macropomum]XP_036434978.1 syntaphilin [Colossoma macropomum]
MSLPANRRPSAGPRSRRPAGTATARNSRGDSSISSSYSTSCCKSTESNTIPRSHPATPRRQAKYAACSENHGIRPPAPEQYLTPLQQKEVCIRHLRARLKENVERLQDRDSEIGELRMQLSRMQEDWIEEECHRIEAQLALKEARKEIRQLQQAVEAVRSNLGIRDSDQQDCKSEGVGVGRLGPRYGASRSCGCSPAHTISRSATFTRLSSETSPGTDRNGNVPLERHIPANRGAATLPRGDGRTHLLLEAALLSEQVPPLPLCSTLSRSSTYEKLCSGETVLPISRPCHAVNNNCSCASHAYLPHHHLFLHLPQDEAPLPPPPPPPPPPPLAPAAPPSASEMSDRPGFRSQACSPTITWISEEEGGGEELSIITSAACASDVTLAEPQTFSLSSATISPSQISYLAEPLPPENLVELTSSATSTPTVLTMPQTQQPCPRASPPPKQAPQEVKVVEVREEDGVGGASTEEEDEQEQVPQRSHWSRYFLIDLLAVAVPVVPTLAWLCRGPQREGMPMYHMGSLLRGCCAVALHSLRRVSSTRSRGPTGTGGTTTI